MARFCTGCGKEIAEGVAFCTECGASARQEAPPQPCPPPVQQAAPFPPATADPHRAAYIPAAALPAAPGAEPLPPKGSKYEPITVGGYVGIMFLMCIPILGQILTIVWACGGCRKVNKRSFARASLIMMAIVLTLSLAIGFLARGLIGGIVGKIESGSGISVSGEKAGDIDEPGGLLGIIRGVAGSDAGAGSATNQDVEALESLGGLLDALGGDGGGLSGLISGAEQANREAEAANDGWPSSLRAYPGGSASAVASYRTEITGTTLEEMLGWIGDLKKDGFVYQDFYDFGMTEEDMLGINGWWAYDGRTYLSVSFADGTVTVDHTKELPNLEDYFGG